jgi:hypothetical protein
LRLSALDIDIGKEGVKKGKRNFNILVLFIAAAAGLGWMIFNRLQATQKPGGGRGGAASTPVEVAQIVRGPIFEWTGTRSQMWG